MKKQDRITLRIIGILLGLLAIRSFYGVVIEANNMAIFPLVLLSGFTILSFILSEAK